MSDDRKTIQLMHMRLEAAKHTIRLARLASAFGSLIESGRMSEESNTPAEELSEVLDLEILTQNEADMPLGQAVQILEDFFEMGIEGQARLEVMLGLGEAEDESSVR